MIPKVGDIVKLNHEFLEVWFKGGMNILEKKYGKKNLQ